MKAFLIGAAILTAANLGVPNPAQAQFFAGIGGGLGAAVGHAGPENGVDESGHGAILRQEEARETCKAPGHGFKEACRGYSHRLKSHKLVETSEHAKVSVPPND